MLCHVKKTKVTLSALESSPKPVVEQEIPHVRNKDCRINKEYVSLKQDMPKTRITGPENSGTLRSLQVLQHVHVYMYLNDWVFGTGSTTLGRFIIHK